MSHDDAWKYADRLARAIDGLLPAARPHAWQEAGAARAAYLAYIKTETGQSAPTMGEGHLKRHEEAIAETERELAEQGAAILDGRAGWDVRCVQCGERFARWQDGLWRYIYPGGLTGVPVAVHTEGCRAAYEAAHTHKTRAPAGDGDWMTLDVLILNLLHPHAGHSRWVPAYTDEGSVRRISATEVQA